MPFSSPSSAVIIGSGIVGASLAYFLSRRGISVQLIEATSPSAEATGAADGAVSVASKKPGRMMQAALKGVQLYAALEREGLFAGIFKRRSTFIIAASADECAVLEAHATALASQGIAVRTEDGTDLRRRFPAMSPDIRLAVEVSGEGHAIGYQIVQKLLAASGVTIRRNTRVERLQMDAGGMRIREAVTSDGSVTADVFIVAAGTGSADLLGLADTLVPRKGQLLVTERAPELNAAMPGAIMSGRYLLSKGSQASANSMPSRGLGLVIDPLMTGQFLIGGTREDFGDRRTNDIDAVSQILAQAVRLIPGLAGLRLLRSFAGVRTAVIDGLPLVGRLGATENGYVATGFEGDGICLGPVMAKSIVQMIFGEEPDVDLAAFAPARFDAQGIAP